MISLLKRYAVLAGLLVLVLLALYLLLRHLVNASDKAPMTNGRAVGGAPLPKEDKEQIIVDPRHHTIVIRRPGGDTVTHLPDRQSVIDIRKDGTVKVTAAQYGVEARPFLGLGYSDDARIAVGLDGAFWKALDIGGGVGVTMRGGSPRAFVALSYTVKDNLRITATIDHKKQPGIMLSLRI